MKSYEFEIHYNSKHNKLVTEQGNTYAEVYHKVIAAHENEIGYLAVVSIL